MMIKAENCWIMFWNGVTQMPYIGISHWLLRKSMYEDAFLPEQVLHGAKPRESRFSFAVVSCLLIGIFPVQGLVCLVCSEEIELGIPEPLGLGLACLGWLVQVKKPMTSAREVHARPQFALGKKGSCLAQLWFNTFTFNLVDLVQEAVMLSIQLPEETQLLSFCSMSSLVDVYSLFYMSLSHMLCWHYCKKSFNNAQNSHFGLPLSLQLFQCFSFPLYWHLIGITYHQLAQPIPTKYGVEGEVSTNFASHLKMLAVITNKTIKAQKYFEGKQL